MKNYVNFLQKQILILKRKFYLLKKTQHIIRYRNSGFVPWSKGYFEYKHRYIQNTLNDPGLLQVFRTGKRLPLGYGWRLDERVIEYPWVFSKILDTSSTFLDAGSVMNFDDLLTRLRSMKKEISILTLAPEKQCYWYKSISYNFADLRRLPFRDEWFDEIVCISTLEHVGMDNTGYGAPRSEYVTSDYIAAANELLRVLKDKGKLLITIPFGKHQEVKRGGKIFMQQFDSHLLNNLRAVFFNCQVGVQFYKYTAGGWNISVESDCQSVEYFNIHETPKIDPDGAAAARSVACIDVTKIDLRK